MAYRSTEDQIPAAEDSIPVCRRPDPGCPKTAYRSAKDQMPKTRSWLPKIPVYRRPDPGCQKRHTGLPKTRSRLSEDQIPDAKDGILVCRRWGPWAAETGHQAAEDGVPGCQRCRVPYVLLKMVSWAAEDRVPTCRRQGWLLTGLTEFSAAGVTGCSKDCRPCLLTGAMALVPVSARNCEVTSTLHGT